MTHPATLSLRAPDYTDMAQTPPERADRTLTWLETTGPCYVTIPARVIKLCDDGAILMLQDELEALKYTWDWFSYGTELALRGSYAGQKLEVKIRVDDAKVDSCRG